jgi:ribosomal protein S18 acetylase RimI-like enzyme
MPNTRFRLDRATFRVDPFRVQSELTYAIVPAGPGDAVDLARVHVEAWRETYPGMLPQVYLDRMSVAIHARRWRHRLMNGGEITLAAETARGLVGYCSGDWARGGARPGEAEISTLYVLRRAQRVGLGARLLTAAARALAARGATSLVIWVLRDNMSARRFYETMGGVADRERDEAIGGGIVASVAYRWADIGTLVG